MNAQPRTPDLAAIKDRQRRAWTLGDYAMLGTTLLITSELPCESADLRPGQEALDVATGSGNTALAAARRFCEVTASTTPRPSWNDGGARRLPGGRGD